MAAQKTVFKRIALESDSESESDASEGSNKEDVSERSSTPSSAYTDGSLEDEIKKLQKQVQRLQESKFCNH